MAAFLSVKFFKSAVDICQRIDMRIWQKFWQMSTIWRMASFNFVVSILPLALQPEFGYFIGTIYRFKDEHAERFW
jgi:hypothetical protein